MTSPELKHQLRIDGPGEAMNPQHLMINVPPGKASACLECLDRDHARACFAIWGSRGECLRVTRTGGTHGSMSRGTCRW